MALDEHDVTRTRAASTTRRSVTRRRSPPHGIDGHAAIGENDPVWPLRRRRRARRACRAPSATRGPGHLPTLQSCCHGEHDSGVDRRRAAGGRDRSAGGRRTSRRVAQHAGPARRARDRRQERVQPQRRRPSALERCRAQRATSVGQPPTAARRDEQRVGARRRGSAMVATTGCSPPKPRHARTVEPARVESTTAATSCGRLAHDAHRGLRSSGVNRPRRAEPDAAGGQASADRVVDADVAVDHSSAERSRAVRRPRRPMVRRRPSFVSSSSTDPTKPVCARLVEVPVTPCSTTRAAADVDATTGTSALIASSAHQAEALGGARQQEDIGQRRSSSSCHGCRGTGDVALQPRAPGELLGHGLLSGPSPTMTSFAGTTPAPLGEHLNHGGDVLDGTEVGGVQMTRVWAAPGAAGAALAGCEDLRIDEVVDHAIGRVMPKSPRARSLRKRLTP